MSQTGQVTLSEEDFLTIHCNYSASGYPALFWYVQYPGEGPQLLFRASKANEKGSSRGFEATYDKESSSFHLQKASVQESDSAVYYCALSDTVTQTAGGAEHKLSTRSLTAELLVLGRTRSRVFHSQLWTETKAKYEAKLPQAEYETPPPSKAV